MPAFPIPIAKDSPFPLENIPFGIFSPSKGTKKRAGTAIGDYVVDLAVLEQYGLFNSVSSAFGTIFSQVVDFILLPVFFYLLTAFQRKH